MGKTYKSGIGTTGERRSPIAPTNVAPGVPAGLFAGAKAPERGTLRRKGGAASGSGGEGPAGNRSQVYERQGARHRVQVKMGYQNAPQASSTQANGKVIPSFGKVRDAWSGGNFWDASRGG